MKFQKTRKNKPQTELPSEVEKQESDVSLTNELTEEKEEEIEETQNRLDLGQYEFISTTINNEIISHDCAVSNNVQPQLNKTEENSLIEEEKLEEENKQEEKDDIQVDTEEPESSHTHNISLQEELAQALNIQETEMPSTPATNIEVVPQTPSAPPVDVSNLVPLTTIVETAPIIQYPSLNKFQYAEDQTEITFKPPKIKSPGFSLTNSKVIPFTAEQHKSIYNCTDLDLVKQFEIEFLMNSLLESQENDPLYAALTEYYKLQSKLTANLQDIEKIRKELEEKEANIWIKVPITKTYSAYCGCKSRVEESITYE